MQLDEDIGKLSATVPPVVCKFAVFKLIFNAARALELFLEELVTEAHQLNLLRNSKTMTPSFMYVYFTL